MFKLVTVLTICLISSSLHVKEIANITRPRDVTLHKLNHGYGKENFSISTVLANKISNKHYHEDTPSFTTVNSNHYDEPVNFRNSRNLNNDYPDSISQKGKTYEDDNYKTLSESQLEVIVKLSRLITTSDTVAVLISSDEALIDISTYNNMMNNIVPTVYIEHNDTEREVLENMKNRVAKENKELIYLIICEDYTLNINDSLNTIRSDDVETRIVIFSTSSLDPEEFYAEHGYFDVFLLVPTVGNNQNYIMYEICRFCAAGVEKVQVVNMWKHPTGFVHQLKLDRSFKGKFYQAGFSIGTRNTYYSVRYAQLRLLGFMLNVTNRYSKYTLKKLNPALRQRQFQLLGYPRAMKYKTMIKYGGAFPPCMDLDPKIIVSEKPPKVLKWYAILLVFDIYTVVFLLLASFGVVLALYKLRNSVKQTSLGEALWSVTQILLWDSTSVHNSDVHVYILLGPYMFMIFLIVSFYMGDMAALLIKPHDAYPPIDTTEQLWATGKKVLTYSKHEESFAELFKYVPNIKERFNPYKYKGNDMTNTALRLMKKNPGKYAFFQRRGRVDYLIQKYHKDRYRNHIFYINNEAITFGCDTWVLPKEAYYREVVNRCVFKMLEMGFLKHYNSRYRSKQIIKSRKKAEKRAIVPQAAMMITISDLGISFMMYAIGITGAFIAFIAGRQAHKR